MTESLTWIILLSILMVVSIGMTILFVRSIEYLEKFHNKLEKTCAAIRHHQQRRGLFASDLDRELYGVLGEDEPYPESGTSNVQAPVG